jgi:hypothetical protein
MLGCAAFRARPRAGAKPVFSAAAQRTCGARGGATTCGAPGGPGKGGAGEGGGDGTGGQAAPKVALKPQFERANVAKKLTPSGPTAATTAVTTSALQKQRAASVAASTRQQALTLPAAFKLQSAESPVNTSSRQLA